MKNILICSLLILFVLPYLKAQTLSRKADQLLQACQRQGQFDGAVLIARADRILYEKQFGLANRQFQVPVTATTKFPVASVSKLYAATLVLALQQEGKLHIDSPVARYLPDLLPNSSRQITVRQLLNHQSGLPNDQVPDYTNRRTPQQFIRNRVADTLLFVPGSRYRYNNINHILLSCIIEQITGKPWDQYLRQVVIDPLHLKSTGVVKRDSVIGQLAYGYHNYAFGNPRVKDPLENDEPLFLENYALAGAMFTTPAELFKFHLALQRRQLLRDPAYVMLYAIDSLQSKQDGRGYWVTPGGYIGTRQIGQATFRVVERNGNINGYNATYLQLPDQQYTFIICCNTDAGDLGKIVDQLVALVLAENP